MDISKVAGYSSINTRNLSDSAIVKGSYSGSSYNDVSGNGLIETGYDFDKVKPTDETKQTSGSAIAAARQSLIEIDEMREQQQQKRDAEALKRAREALENIRSRPLALKFDTVDDFDNAHVLRVVDAHSEELIRQIPSEELLRVSHMISNYKERVAHEEMITDPQLKSKGITTNAQENENLRGVVFDDAIQP